MIKLGSDPEGHTRRGSYKHLLHPCQAVRLANDTPYGLANAVRGHSPTRDCLVGMGRAIKSQF